MLAAERQSARVSKITNDGLHRMFYSCTHMATVDVKGLMNITLTDGDDMMMMK